MARLWERSHLLAYAVLPMAFTPPTRATLIEVARLAGTSKTSVSRFFGPERDKLSATLQARIEGAAAALDYRPNLMARSLKGSGSRLLGLLVADIRNPYSVAVIHGAEMLCRQHGYALIVANTDNDDAREQDLLDALDAYRVEGVILNATGLPERQLDTLRDRALPLVLLDRDLGLPELDVIGLDDEGAIDMALNHLHAKGYRAVLYVGEAPERASSRRARLERFEARSQTLAMAASSVIAGKDAEPTLEDTIGAFVARHPTTPGAVLAANGNVTLAVAHAFRALGLTMGPIGFMGIDDMPWCALVGPGITTLAQPTEAIGQAAAACLLNRLMPLDLAFEHRHRPTLIARGSTQRI